MVTKLNEDFRSKTDSLGAKVTLDAKPTWRLPFYKRP